MKKILLLAVFLVMSVTSCTTGTKNDPVAADSVAVIGNVDTTKVADSCAVAIDSCAVDTTKK